MNQRQINIHPILYISGFTVLLSFILGFPFGTFLGIAIGIGISKKRQDIKK